MPNRNSALAQKSTSKPRWAVGLTDDECQLARASLQTFRRDAVANHDMAPGYVSHVQHSILRMIRLLGKPPWCWTPSDCIALPTLLKREGLAESSILVCLSHARAFLKVIDPLDAVNALWPFKAAIQAVASDIQRTRGKGVPRPS